MQIEVNGELKDFPNPTTLKSLVEIMLSDTKGTAVAVNNSVVPKAEWETMQLSENDKVLLIKATQGG